MGYAQPHWSGAIAVVLDLLGNLPGATQVPWVPWVPLQLRNRPQYLHRAHSHAKLNN